MRSKLFATAGLAVLLAAAGCGTDDQAGDVGTTEQIGTPSAADTGFGATTPTTGPGMAPTAPGMAGDTMMQDTMMNQTGAGAPGAP